MPREEQSQSVKVFEEGKWFRSAGYWLFPVNLLDGLSDRLDKFTEQKTAANLAVSGPVMEAPLIKPASKSEAEAITAGLKAPAESHHGHFEREYNAQPVWRFEELRVGSASDARSVANEFLRMVSETSGEFCWPLNDPGKSCHWRVHAWKHISYTDMKRFWRDHLEGTEPAANRALALGTEHQIRELFLAAAKRDPEATGIIWSQFPQEEDHREIIDFFFLKSEAPKGIPHPTQLACELVHLIFTRPASEEAENARKSLMKLVSTSVHRGSPSKRGRPKSRVPKASLFLLWKMSYALVVQVFELNEFLGAYKELKKEKPTILLNAYPWINRIARTLEDFVYLGKSKAALELEACLTGISSSALEKMGLRSRS
jgi:hypothetical protein